MNITEFTPNELEFFTESSLVEITPNFAFDTLNLIAGDFGPFKPGIPISVPLWLGIYLRRRSKCKIIPPAWLSIEFLSEASNTEKLDKVALSPLPYNFEEFSSLLTKNAVEDVKNIARVKSLLEDIKNVRYAKLNEMISNLSPDDSFVNISNITSVELNKFRNILDITLQNLNNIKQQKENKEEFGAGNNEVTQSQSQN